MLNRRKLKVMVSWRSWRKRVKEIARFFWKGIIALDWHWFPTGILMLFMGIPMFLLELLIGTAIFLPCRGLWVFTRSRIAAESALLGGAFSLSLFLYFEPKLGIGWLRSLVEGWFEPSFVHVYEDIPTGKLSGTQAGGLFASYFGTTRLPDTLHVSWTKQLDKMWQRKRDISGNNYTAVRTGNVLLEEYNENDKTQVSLEEYVSHMNADCKDMWEEMDWQKAGEELRLTNDRLAILKSVSKKLSGTALMSYAMTEVMPRGDPQANIVLADFLLQHAGREFLESVPALGDAYTSIGPFQFTQFAVYEVKAEFRGASFLNSCLPTELRVPGSVSKLRGDDHHRAGWLFAVYNVGLILQELTPEELAEFKDLEPLPFEDVLAYVAASHHLPKHSRIAFKAWLKNPKLPLTDFLPNTGRDPLRGYGEITIRNYNALLIWSRSFAGLASLFPFL